VKKYSLPANSAQSPVKTKYFSSRSHLIIVLGKCQHEISNPVEWVDEINSARPVHECNSTYKTFSIMSSSNNLFEQKSTLNLFASVQTTLGGVAASTKECQTNVTKLNSPPVPISGRKNMMQNKNKYRTKSSQRCCDSCLGKTHHVPPEDDGSNRKCRRKKVEC